MLFKYLVLPAAAILLLSDLCAHSAHADAITLEEALRRAARHPSIEASDADVDVARGDRLAARTYLHNPELGVSVGPRFAASRSVDVDVSLSQTFELGGKRDARVAVATAGVRQVQAERAHRLQVVRWSVRAAFGRALVARDRVSSTAEAEAVAAELADLARARLAAGSSDRLSVNQAIAEVGRATRERLLAEQAYEQACYELSSAVGIAGGIKLEPSGEDAPRPTPAPSADAAVELAIGSRFDLAAVREQTNQARANARLQKSLAVPDLTAGVVFAREETSEIGLLTLSMPLPLWNRNQGARAAATAATRRSVALQGLASAEVERQVRVAYDRWVKAKAAVEAFDQQALGTLRENLDLTRESFESGKLSLVEYTLLRRSFVEVQLDLLDAVATEIDAYYALRLSLGEDGSSR